MVASLGEKVSKSGVFSGPFFPYSGKYGPEKTSYLDSFHIVHLSKKWQFQFITDCAKSCFSCIRNMDFLWAMEIWRLRKTP